MCRRQRRVLLPFPPPRPSPLLRLSASPPLRPFPLPPLRASPPFNLTWLTSLPPSALWPPSPLFSCLSPPSFASFLRSNQWQISIFDIRGEEGRSVNRAGRPGTQQREGIIPAQQQSSLTCSAAARTGTRSSQHPPKQASAYRTRMIIGRKCTMCVQGWRDEQDGTGRVGKLRRRTATDWADALVCCALSNALQDTELLRKRRGGGCPARCTGRSSPHSC